MNKKAAANLYRFFRLRKDEKQMVIAGIHADPSGANQP